MTTLKEKVHSVKAFFQPHIYKNNIDHKLFESTMMHKNAANSMALFTNDFFHGMYPKLITRFEMYRSLDYWVRIMTLDASVV